MPVRATRWDARAGVALDFGDKLSGEASAGWVHEDFDDARGSRLISGLSAAANLDWSPVRGTTVNLAGSTTLEGSTTADDSGSILYSSTLSATRQMRDNLTGYGADQCGLARLCRLARPRPDACRRGEPDLVAQPLSRHDRPCAPRTPAQHHSGARLRRHQRLSGHAAPALTRAARPAMPPVRTPAAQAWLAVFRPAT